MDQGQVGHDDSAIKTAKAPTKFQKQRPLDLLIFLYQCHRDILIQVHLYDENLHRSLQFAIFAI
jgi:hypothetical protein